MKISEYYLPEGSPQTLAATRAACESVNALRRAQEEGAVLEAVALRCTAEHDLKFDLGVAEGVMPREECALGIAEGDAREIAILSRVGKPTCFAVTGINDTVAPPRAHLSRALLQRRVRDDLLETLRAGDVIPARVTHLEPFGAFVDIGCGVNSLIGIENLSVSRIFHPRDRLRVGQDIFGAVLSVDQAGRRITLTHRELLGTWEQNAALFAPGETVRGVVRSVEPYGVFIELAPNLSGLAEPRGDLAAGDTVSVFIKSILSARMKIKLTVIDVLGANEPPPPPHYFVTEGHLDQWVYTPRDCDRKYIATVF